MLTVLISLLITLPWAVLLCCWFIAAGRWWKTELAAKSAKKRSGSALDPSEITTVCMDCNAWISGPRDGGFLSHGLCHACAKLRLVELESLSLTPDH